MIEIGRSDFFLFCKYCGNEIQNNSLFCRVCGNKINNAEES